MELLNRRRYGGRLSEAPEHTLEFIFNQTGEGEVVTPLVDTGLLDYLVENIKAYQGKYQEDGSMVVTPIKTEIDSRFNKKYYFYFTSYLDDTKVDDYNYQLDFFVQIPTIYYKCEEISTDKFKIKFSVLPFSSCHKVFGEDNLIGYGSGTYYDDKFYSSLRSDDMHISFTKAREAIENRGKGYYGFTSDEMGVLMFLNIYYDGVNGDVLSVFNNFLGVQAKWSNGREFRNYIPNIEIENAIAKVTHLDNSVEIFNIPYIWSEEIKTFYIGEYLTFIPKEKGKGIYYTSHSWVGNQEGTGLYLPNRENWSVAGDRNDDSITTVCIKIRPCFKGKLVETQDVEWFKSLPIIN